MSHPYYQRCCSCLGKCVLIRTRDGRTIHGQVHRVTNEHVYLNPLGRPVGVTQRDQKQGIKGLQAVDLTGNELGEKVLFFPFIVPLAAIAGLTIVGTAPFWGRGFFW